ncbi:MAG: hypothetical protein ACJ72D_20450 [Marmoricola sp.]
MTRARTALIIALLGAVLVPGLRGVGATAATTPVGSAISGTTCHPFPASNWWHVDIRKLPVHKTSRTWLSHMSSSSRLHPDFGPSYGDGPNYGIPITVVDSSHPRVTVTFDYSEESDHVGYPLGDDTRIEGGRGSSGDKHAIVVDKSTCRLYETWDTRVSGAAWRAGSGATWSLTSNALRPNGWTSADAAGLPILPGLLRYNEVVGGYVDHAIRFTTNLTSSHHYWPARHDAGSTSSWLYPPMGTRFRLRSTYDSSHLSWQARVVVAAMKRYGLVLADNGSPWYFQGEQDARWGDTLISDLKKIPASAFQAVDTRSLVP